MPSFMAIMKVKAQELKYKAKYAHAKLQQEAKKKQMFKNGSFAGGGMADFNNNRNDSYSRNDSNASGGMKHPAFDSPQRIRRITTASSISPTGPRQSVFNRLEAENSDLKNKLSSQQKKIDGKNKELKKQKKELAKRKEKIKKLENELSQRDQMINGLEDQVNQLLHDFNSLKARKLVQVMYKVDDALEQIRYKIKELQERFVENENGARIAAEYGKVKRKVKEKIVEFKNIENGPYEKAMIQLNKQKQQLKELKFKIKDQLNQRQGGGGGEYYGDERNYGQEQGYY